MSISKEKLEKHRIRRKDIKPSAKDLSTATPIESGGFGSIYKGKLSQDSVVHQTVAIKCLLKEGSQENIKFHEELDTVCKFHHQNIVHVIGYCHNNDDDNDNDDDPDKEIIIVYEYAVNGDLDSHLNNSAKRDKLTWAQRLKICLGVARGLKYLHSGLVENKIVIHRDLKSSNILLDDIMEAKICDFGLSKLGSGNQSQAEIVTRIAGTNFYIDPLYHQTGILTKESDIYSFGVVMFEMLSGMMAYQERSDVDGNVLCLMGLVQRYNKKALDNLIDPIIKDDIDMDSFDIFKDIAQACVILNKDRRPTPDIIIHRIQQALDIQENYDSSVATDKADTKILRILKLDPGLGPYKDHFEHRMMRFSEQKRLIDLYEGGLEEFAKGYLKFGINSEGGSIIYREWAPAAENGQLIGDFNRWDGSNHMMERNQFGVWTITIPDVAGISAIDHDSVVKFRFKHNNGDWIDRLPAWIKFTKSAATYEGVYWDPPASERHKWKYPRPPKPQALHIYSAHVGMRSSEPRVNSYREFADNILPRVWANKYNTLQLKTVMEHSHYGPSGCHVTNFFSVSNSSGTPEDLKYLVDEAHRLGLRVLMDVFHSHASMNLTHGLHGFDVGQPTQDSYFHTGERGYHTLWGSRLFNYSNWEVLRFLLSNLRWWLEEFKVDGFCFKGVTSMLYDHHGINFGFSGDYKQYFSESTHVDAVVYMMLANDLIHSLLPDATVIAEDISGMPGLGMRVDEGGIGFDFC